MTIADEPPKTKKQIIIDILLKICIYILLVIIAVILGAIYGVLHDLLTYSISNEYYTKFKFIQFGINLVSAPDYLGVIEVGIRATWWMGLFIGLILGLIGFIQKDHKKMFKYSFQAFVLTVVVAFATGLVGLIYGYILLAGKAPSHFIGWFIPEGLQNFRNFIAVGSMHNFSYLGGCIGLIVGIIWQIYRKISRQTFRQHLQIMIDKASKRKTVIILIVEIMVTIFAILYLAKFLNHENHFIRLILSLCITMWAVWVLFILLLLTIYKRKFNITFENFNEYYYTRRSESKKYDPRLVIKGFIGNKQIEVSSAKTYKNNIFQQEASGRLQWSFGYSDIHKELEVRNLKDFDRIELIIMPTWAYLSWFPLVFPILIDIKIDAVELKTYISVNANGSFDHEYRMYIEYYPLNKNLYEFKRNY